MFDERCVACDRAAATVAAAAHVVLLVQCLPSTVSYLYHVDLLLSIHMSDASQVYRLLLCMHCVLQRCRYMAAHVVKGPGVSAFWLRMGIIKDRVLPGACLPDCM